MNTNAQLQKLAGVSAIVGGLMILVFAIASETKGIFFVPEIYSGEPIDRWLQNISDNPSFVKWIMILPMIGFSSMLLFGASLYQLIDGRKWQKTLALVSYTIGVAAVVSAFASHHSLLNYVSGLLEAGEMSFFDIEKLIGSEVFRWNLFNDLIGPLFIIVLGTGFMSLAALRSGLLPKWLCFWAFIVSTLLFFSFLSAFIPDIEVLGNAAPFHMLWLVVTGIYLLRLKPQS